jgi:hypothetical protein
MTNKEKRMRNYIAYVEFLRTSVKAFCEDMDLEQLEKLEIHHRVTDICKTAKAAARECRAVKGCVMTKANDDTFPTIEQWWGTADEFDEYVHELIDKYIDMTGDEGSWEECQAWVNDWFWQARREIKKSTFRKWLKHAKGTESPN